MLSKEKILELYTTYHYNSNNIPKKYCPLFTVNGFMRFMEGSIFTEQDREQILKFTHSVYCGDFFNVNGKYSKEPWTEEFIIPLIKNIICRDIYYIGAYMYSRYEYREIVEGLICVLEDTIEHKVYDEYKKFYNDVDYGYFNMPRYLDILIHYDLLDADIKNSLNYIKGFVIETDVEPFDLTTWKEHFKSSNQITMLKDVYIKKDGIVSDKFSSIKFVEYEKEYLDSIQKVANVDLRKVDTGKTYLIELIQKTGFIIGWNTVKPIYKLNTVQGISFYLYDNEVYCSDISIKSIKFNKIVSTAELDKEQRIFIIYNKTTGYWCLPELYYPKVYKQYILEVLKKQKDIIGNWKDTCVFANSRTLCGDTYVFKLNNYPDIRKKEDFISVLFNIKCLPTLNNFYKEFGLNVEYNYDINSINFDSVIKPLNCISQEDVNNFVNGNNEKFEIIKF